MAILKNNSIRWQSGRHHDTAQWGRANLAMVSLAMGLISLITLVSFWFMPPFNLIVSGMASIVAIATGVMALRVSSQEHGNGKTKAFAVAGIAAGMVGPLIVLAVVIIQGTAINDAGSVRDQSNEGYYQYLDEIEHEGPGFPQPWQYPSPP